MTGAIVPAVRRLGPAWRTVQPAGRALLAVGFVAWLFAWRLGWGELAIVAGACLVLLATTALFMIGRTRLAVRMIVEPPRVTVGDAVSGSIEATNQAKGPLLPVTLELPVGQGGVAFGLPLLAPGKSHEELFVVPTERRGVIAVGPVSSVRGDPVGLFRRDIAWTGVTEIFVHPRIVPLDPLGAGLVRDLEGSTSQAVSMSDLAFHALREYSPGDDLRHVHWRSSARHGQLLVRQFLDTRRSHLAIVVDSRPEAYGREQDYETAISVAGSLLVRAVRDEYDATFVSGPYAASRVTGRAVLDVCSRAEPGPAALTATAGNAVRLAPDTSIAFLVSGPNTPYVDLQRAAHQFPIDVVKVAVQVDSSAAATLRSAGDLPLLTLGQLEELPGLMRWAIP